MSERSTTVSIDDWLGPFPAKVLTNYRWNGWVIPRFSKETAEKLVAQFNEATEGHPDNGTLSWEGENVVLTTPAGAYDENEWRDVFEPDPDGYYPIGAMSWTWSEVE